MSNKTLIVVAELAAAVTAAAFQQWWLAGSLALSAVATALQPGPQNQEGPRASGLQVTNSEEGSGMPEVIGSARLGGQVIWARDFLEHKHNDPVGGKGSSGGDQITYTFTLNMAVGICEGVIDRIGRIWADGKILDTTNITFRVYRGTSTQLPDALIEGFEGVGNTSAYRDTAYVVFEAFDVTQFGNRIPQFNFEVFRSKTESDGLEALIGAVQVSPAYGEFTLDTKIEFEKIADTATTPINQYYGVDQADSITALDQIKSSLANIGTAVITIAWFGDDLRCAFCDVKPRVQSTLAETTPDTWKVHTLDSAAEADEVSKFGGRSAFGGTPTDASIARLARELKQRGYEVTLKPIVLMDISHSNTLPNPYSNNAASSTQEFYPSCGRITISPAIGFTGTVDQTVTAYNQINTFFGLAAAADFTVSVNAGTNAVTSAFTGDDDEWGYRRFIFHYAKLAEAINTVDAGTITGFLIGSGLAGLTSARNDATSFRAIDQLVYVATQCAGFFDAGIKVGYAADWTEYNNYRAPDGSGDIFFNLDPLWANGNIHFVGINWYAPMSDWREGLSHTDAVAGAADIYDLTYLKGNIEGGEFFNWKYTSSANRDDQVRTTIVDLGGYGKPWVYRAKDLRAWWLNRHKDRPGGIESGSFTSWLAQSKPIRLMFGIPSVDKGTNQPDALIDTKASSSAVPYYSRSSRDDAVQRAGLKAMLSYWTGATNPTSSVYSAPMIAMIAIDAIDIRPFPTWPSRSDIWTDTGQQPTGRTLTGKIGLADLSEVIASRCERVPGFTAFDASKLNGIVTGYIRPGPMSPKAEIEAFMGVYAFDAVESGGSIVFVPRGLKAVATITLDDLVLPESNQAFKMSRQQETDLHDAVGVSYIDVAKDYQSGGPAWWRRHAGFSSRIATLNLPITMDFGQAQAIADRSGREEWIGRESLSLALPPKFIALDTTDVIKFAPGSSLFDWRIVKIRDSDVRTLELQRCEASVYPLPLAGIQALGAQEAQAFGAPLVEIMDMPTLDPRDEHDAPYVAVYAAPFSRIAIMSSLTGTSYSLNSLVKSPATMGKTLTDFYSGRTLGFDGKNVLRVKLFNSAVLASVDKSIILSTHRQNRFAIKNDDGEWEICQFATAALVSGSTYDLSDLVRGLKGTEGAMRDPVNSGARFVLLDGAIEQLDLSIEDRGIERPYKWGPHNRDITNSQLWLSANFSFSAKGLRPFAPTHFRMVEQGSGDKLFKWHRRTRIDGDSFEGLDVPLAEEYEEYDLRILDEDGNTVRHFKSVPQESQLWTAAQQVSDFPTGLPDPLQASVAQNSPWGRGEERTENF